MLLRKILAAGLVGVTSIVLSYNSHAATINVLQLARGELIEVSGDFQAGDHERFTEALQAAKKPVVTFNSPGGVLSVGLGIGNAIRFYESLKDVAVAVADGEMCASACALAWLGASQRAIMGTGRVGFHAAYRTGTDGKPIEKGAANAMIGSYLSKLGLNDRAIFYITNSAPAEMQWLTKADADRYGIQVEFIDPPNAGAVAPPPAPGPQTTTGPVPPQIPPPSAPVAPAAGTPPNLAPTPFPPQRIVVDPPPPAPLVPVAPAPAPSPALPKCYVDDVRPPDAWLALRSEPTDKRGIQVTKLYPGQPLEIMGPRENEFWYLVRGPDGRTGWVSWQLPRWISCPGQRP